MARKKRIWKEHHCHHVILRGIGGKSIFNDNFDRVRFCLLLQEATECHCQRIHAFCLMSNHIHLVVEPTQGPLKDAIHNVAFRYAQYFNRRHCKRGYLFQGRFRSILVEDGLYLRQLTRYIHLNPVDAGIVKHPDEYVWSSHNAYLGHATYNWLIIERVLSMFSESLLEAQAKFAEFAHLKIDAHRDADEIHRASMTGVYGTSEFVRIHAPESKEITKDAQVRLPLQLSFEELTNRVCARFNTSFSQLCGSSKIKVLVEARSVLARSWQLVDGSLGDVCRTLGKHHGSVSRLATKAAQTPELVSIVHELLTA